MNHHSGNPEGNKWQARGQANVAAHDEWLLDEALAETFPASDPIAVSPHSSTLDRPAWLP